MSKQSAGILLFRKNKEIEYFLVHPGGPFFSKKDAGVWSIPKGEFTENESPVQAALREFKEETGAVLTSNNIMVLTPVKQKAGKIVHCFAIEGDIDPLGIKCNTFTMQWPPGSGISREFPEVDKAGWFNGKEASQKINPAQFAFIIELNQLLS